MTVSPLSSLNWENDNSVARSGSAIMAVLHDAMIKFATNGEVPELWRGGRGGGRPVPRVRRADGRVARGQSRARGERDSSARRRVRCAQADRRAHHAAAD